MSFMHCFRRLTLMLYMQPFASLLQHWHFIRSRCCSCGRWPVCRVICSAPVLRSQNYELISMLFSQLTTLPVYGILFLSAYSSEILFCCVFFLNHTLKPQMMCNPDFTPTVRVGLCMITRDYDGEPKTRFPRWTTSLSSSAIRFL